jgi:hypothetical protein
MGLAGVGPTFSVLSHRPIRNRTAEAAAVEVSSQISATNDQRIFLWLAPRF